MSATVMATDATRGLVVRLKATFGALIDVESESCYRSSSPAPSLLNKMV